MILIKNLTRLFLIASVMLACNDSEKTGNKNPVQGSEASEVRIVKELTSSGKIKNLLEKVSDSTYTGKLELDNFKEVSEFYEARDNEPIWNDPILRKSLLSQVDSAKNEGLFPEDYHREYLYNSLENIGTLNIEQLNELELGLTDAYFSLAGDLSTGKLDPKKLYSIWDIKSYSPNLFKLLDSALTKQDIQWALDSVKPKHLVYQGLKKSLKEYEVLKDSEKEITRISLGKLVRPGEIDPRIPRIKKRLQELNLISTIINPDSLSTTYNRNIEEGIRTFQKQSDLEIDGIIGNTTIENLNKNYEDRYNQILANLERWRWHPRDFGDHYIIINIANYRLHIIKDKDTVGTHKTMVGTEARKTPVFSKDLGYVVYNPTWTIPPTIKKRDVIPSATKDPSYLKKKKLNVYDRDGNKLDPSTIDWSSPEALRYTYRQNAGSTNPLGRVKIIYPNRYMIYLHDTPSQSLFNKNKRAQSSGCVRVENAIPLSKYLLSDQEKYSEEKIEEVIASGKTTEIKITQPIQIHHLYWTAWREKGITHFADDVYHLDEEIFSKLKN
ncbi:L,D-transpeptidase family protein [Salegentibacter chungangensis]|uniref:Murein L,D-transpeptidase n=1 Tax=Salegentibacter chungangensis TaxID=1335724 RepID=A0ABW3NQ15_9FLAO